MTRRARDRRRHAEFPRCCDYEAALCRCDRIPGLHFEFRHDKWCRFYQRRKASTS
jgi:hypothetical protein